MSPAVNRVDGSRNNVLFCLYTAVRREVKLTYSLMESNFDAAFVPFPIFTTASLIYRRATYQEAISSLAYATLYGFFFSYSIDLANNAEGGAIEDHINKPNRPIVQSRTTVAATKIRFYMACGTWLLLSYVLDLYIWSLLWIVILLFHYQLHVSRIGPAKDLSMALGVISQLMACWKLGGSDTESGWRWVKLIIVWTFFTVPIQDFRDIPGDLAAGRKTTPILLGDYPARIYTSLGLMSTEVSFHDTIIPNCCYY
ncbi:hypothetical protein ASPBRDRAFT_57361 [Aspergillus brasiliensis CBS 101740]|uniref:Uncharacterized protein n=1 Tax=Aspergillus brasiliensis (strain CBS 101740 / IMI 381727 / IBT 21946) TaxID=767769 RepID=A0A1L9UDL9_ASPBC|nr:hypothetical protein ASPBRDRAFT_57361 [Aspergillus brasiliensis CBS 101740]